MVAIAIIAVVALVLLATIPLARGSGSGSVRLQPNGSGYGFGWQETNLSAGGSTVVSWNLTDTGAQGALVVIFGTCTTFFTCANATNNRTMCASPQGALVQLIGAVSGTCTFVATADTYTILAVEISGYQAGDKVDFSYATSAPIL